MNKRIIFALSVFGVLWGALFAGTHELILNTPYNATLCKAGKTDRWTGGCACRDPKAISGRYCDQPVGATCKTNEQCQTNEFCFYPNKETTGVCHPATHYPAVTRGWWLWKKSYVLSGELMNWPSAQSFCSALNGRIISRKDFECEGMGVGCLNTDLVLALRPENGLGFFWLDADEQDPAQAYYADFNDAIVYRYKKTSAAVTQALCVLSEK